jgi:hypothetical protein
MKKILLVIPFMFLNVHALSDVAVPNTFVDSALIVASEFNQNFDTLEFYYNILLDTLNQKFIRTSYLESGDTTLQLIKVDSLFSTKGIKGTRFTGAVTGDLTGTADSAKGAHHLTGGAVSATTGLFSGTVSADSVYSSKGLTFGAGITATTGIFSGDVFTTAFTSWTPTLSAAGGTPPEYQTIICYYHKIGKMVFYSIYLSDDGGNEGAGSVMLGITLPVNVNEYCKVIGSGRYGNSTTVGGLIVRYYNHNIAALFLDNDSRYLEAADQNNATRFIELFGCYEAE